MLVLTRKIGDTIIIDDKDGKIVITVLKVRGNSISLGINAPKDRRISRGELLAEQEEPEEEACKLPLPQA